MTVAVDQFRHEALLYSGPDGLLAGCIPFIKGGLEAGEPVLVVESAAKIALLREALGADAAAVHFADMAEVGANPARIIPAWKEFVDRDGAEGKRLRGIGEPIWAERTAEQLVECQRHESLLNVAFGDGQPWWLLCPYDVANLAPAVVAEALRSHEFVTEIGGVSRASEHYRGLDASGAPFDAAFDEPDHAVNVLTFDRENLFAIRRSVTRQALAAGLSVDRATALVSAVNEVATNSVVHGGGTGNLRTWRQSDGLVCEVRDSGVYHHPLADRRRPGSGAGESRGLWLANQLCDLVQIRTFPEGTAVRLHMRLGE